MRVVPAAAGGLTMGMGVLVLIGWTIGNETLKRVVPGFVAMNPMTAVCFLCAGLSLWLLCDRHLSRRRAFLAGMLALTVVCVGLLKIVGLTTGWSLGVDQILFPSKLTEIVDSLPNRMAPNTAWSFVLIGVSLLTLHRQGERISLAQLCAIVAAFSALLPIIGYIYGVKEFRGLAAFIPMAVHTAGTFLLLSAGLLFARPTPLTRVFTSDGPTGILARRLLPMIILATIFLGWLRLWAEREGLYEAAFGTALFVVTLGVIFVLLSAGRRAP